MGARDPDALIDMVELEIDEKRREQIKYKFRVKRLQKLLDAEAPDWRNGLDMEDAERAEKLISIARDRLPDKTDAVNNDELRQSDAMTGWRIGGILREFPGFTPRYAFFRYPIHVTGSRIFTTFTASPSRLPPTSTCGTCAASRSPWTILRRV